MRGRKAREFELKGGETHVYPVDLQVLLAMRRTLWTVRAADLPLIQSAASDRVADNERRRLAADAVKAGIADDGDTWLDTACAAVLLWLA